MEGCSENFLSESLMLAGIEGQRRGETLSVEEFGNLSNILQR